MAASASLSLSFAFSLSLLLLFLRLNLRLFVSLFFAACFIHRPLRCSYSMMIATCHAVLLHAVVTRHRCSVFFQSFAIYRFLPFICVRAAFVSTLDPLPSSSPFVSNCFVLSRQNLPSPRGIDARIIGNRESDFREKMTLSFRNCGSTIHPTIFITNR